RNSSPNRTAIPHREQRSARVLGFDHKRTTHWALHPNNWRHIRRERTTDVFCNNGHVTSRRSSSNINQGRNDKRRRQGLCVEQVHHRQPVLPLQSSRWLVVSQLPLVPQPPTTTAQPQQ